VLELLITTDKSIVITWRGIKYAIQGKMRTSAVLVLLDHVKETAMIKTIAPTAAANGYDARVVLPCIKAHLLVYKKLYKEDLEMVVKYSRNSEDLLEFLNLSEPSHTTIPTWRTINRLLSGKFNEDTCNLFFDKYPYAQIVPENSENISNLEMSATFYARLLLINSQMRVSASMMEKLPGQVPEDLYLLFLSRTNVPLSPRKVVEAMNRKFGEPTIRFMIRSCASSIRVHHIESFKQAVLDNGYSENLGEFIDASLKIYSKQS
jgi:hypothetical protein